MSTTLSTSTKQPLADSTIDAIWRRLTVYHGAGFVQKATAGLDPVPIKGEWAKKLAEYTQAEIKAGLRRCETQPYPPSLAEFLSFCRPQADYESAYAEAQRGLYARRYDQDIEWSSPAVFYAALTMPYEVSQLTYRQNAERWRRALDNAIAEHTQNPRDVPAIAPKLPRPPADPEVSARHLAKIRAMMQKSQPAE